MPRRAAPAQRQHAVDDAADARLRAIAQRREVGNQTDEPEQRRHRRVGRDGEHVPDQRAAELRPDAHRVRVGQQPVREPRTAGVEQRKDAGAGDREQRHRFGKPVDRRAPALFEQQQDRGDQRAGVADADPPDEVRDVERPADRNVVAPDADALDGQVGERDQQQNREAAGREKAEIPAERRPLREDDRADLVGDRSKRVARRDHIGRAHADVGRCERILVVGVCCSAISRRAPDSRFVSPPDTSFAAAY